MISFLEWTERRNISLDAIHDSESQKKALYDFRQKIRHFRHVGFLNLFRIPELKDWKNQPFTKSLFYDDSRPIQVQHLGKWICGIAIALGSDAYGGKVCAGLIKRTDGFRVRGVYLPPDSFYKGQCTIPHFFSQHQSGRAVGVGFLGGKLLFLLGKQANRLIWDRSVIMVS